MKNLLQKGMILTALTMIAAIFCVQLQAAIVPGTIGNGTFVDYEGNESTAYGLDFNNDGDLEFVITTTGFDVDFTNCYLQYTWSENGNNIWTSGSMETEGWDEVYPLTANTVIDAQGNWEAQGDAYLVSMFESTPFLPLNTESYIGFKIKIGNAIHYGWAKVQLTGDAATGFTANWISCAYENTPQTAILAGSEGVGIESTQISNIVAFPNPVVDVVTIQMNQIQNNPAISVYNMLGERMSVNYTYDNSMVAIEMQSLSSGIYFIKIQGLNEEETIKIIKQ